jgi:protein translocase SecG subunit
MNQSMHTLFLITQIILGVVVTGCILLQAQGSGLGTTWAGGGETYHTKRGVEKVVFYISIVGVALFTLNSLGLLLTS